MKKYFLIKNRKYDHSNIWNAIIKDYFVKATTTTTDPPLMSRNNPLPLIEANTTQFNQINSTTEEYVSQNSERESVEDSGSLLGKNCYYSTIR